MGISKMMIVLFTLTMGLLLSACANSTENVLLDVISETPDLTLEEEIHNIENDITVNEFFSDLKVLGIEAIEPEDVLVRWIDYNEHETHYLQLIIEDDYVLEDIDYCVLKEPLKKLYDAIVINAYYDTVSISFFNTSLSISYSAEIFDIESEYIYGGSFVDGVDNFEATIKDIIGNVDYTRSYIRIIFDDVQLVLVRYGDDIVTVYNWQCYPDQHLCTEEGYQEIETILKSYLPALSFVDEDGS